MKKYNSMLKSARLEKSWTREFVSEQVGVSLNTYSRWETGVQLPRHASLYALCEIFKMSPEELGFADIIARHSQHIERLETHTKKSHNRMPRSKESRTASENPTLWSIGIATCWQLYMLGEPAELTQLLPSYLSKLTRSTLRPGPDQKLAAGLAAQVYQLIALLDLQHGDFVAAQINGTQALVYSQLAKDWNIYIASQLRLAAIFMARKRIGSALSAYNDALHCVNLENEAISPILHSWIFAGLAEIQATMGRKQEALQFLKLAFAVFPEKLEIGMNLSYAECDRSMLYFYEGLVFLRLGQPKFAWDALAEIDEMKPLPPPRARAEFLKQKAYTSIILGNMTQSCIYLEAAAKAAQEIKSDLAFSEVYALYEHLLAHWGQEARVIALAQLFQR
jgi:transcriptional regulator with XRE-family HTH domain